MFESANAMAFERVTWHPSTGAPLGSILPFFLFLDPPLRGLKIGAKGEAGFYGMEAENHAEQKKDGQTS